MKSFIVVHTHYETPGVTRAFGPYCDEENAELVRRGLESLTGDVYGSGTWSVITIVLLEIPEATS